MLRSQHKPRLLVITSTFPRWLGDTEPRFVLDLCRHLSSEFEIQVLAPHAPGTAREESIEGIRVKRYRYFIPSWQSLVYEGGILARLRTQPWRILQLPFLLSSQWWTVRNFIRTWKPDVIHAHWLLPQGLVACIAARGRTPVVCTSHGGDLFGLRDMLSRCLKAWTLKQCSAVTVVSQSMVEVVSQLSPKTTVEVIPMGTDLSGLFTPPHASVVREDNHIIFVGRLVEKKGIRYLLEAFARLRNLHSDLKLTVIGDGPLEGEIQRMVSALGIEKATFLLGSLPHNELPRFYRRATFAVFPFVVARGGDQEGFGLVVVEAMGCGCPVIASDLPAIHHSITPEVTGILVPAGNVDALADAIQRCLSDASLRSRMAVSAQRSVRERFDWPSVAARYSGLFKNIINR